jgi:protein required for attachment to host cells
MIVRILEPRCIGSRQSYEQAQKFLAKADSRHTVQMVEIVKRPGQTLGELRKKLKKKIFK